MSMIDFFPEVLDHLVRSIPSWFVTDRESGLRHNNSHLRHREYSLIHYNYTSGTVNTASVITTTHQAPWIRPQSSQLHIRHREYGLSNHNYTSGTVNTASVITTTHQRPWIRPKSSQLHIRHREYGLNNHNYNSGTVNTASSIITHTSVCCEKHLYMASSITGYSPTHPYSHLRRYEYVNPWRQLQRNAFCQF